MSDPGPDPPSGPGGSVTQNRRTAAAVLLGSMLLTVALYLPALEAGFYFDDDANIVEEPALHWHRLDLDAASELLVVKRHPKRIVPNITFGLNHLIGGLDPRGYHLFNVLVHLAVGAAVAWTATLLAGTASGRGPQRVIPLAGAVAGALFLLHPLNIQAVTYVVQRMASLAALFSLLGFGCYLVARRSETRARAGLFSFLALVSWVMALGSKENAVVMPLVVVAYEIAFHHREWRRRATAAIEGRGVWALSLALLVPLVVGVLIWKLYLGGIGVLWTEQFPGRDFSGLERVLTQGRVHLLYLGLLLWPAPQRLNLDHDFAISRSLLDPPSTLLAALFWLALAGLAFRLLRRHPRYGFPVLAYLLLHSVESAPLSLELVFEHRMYLPMAALAWLLAAAIADLRRLPRRVILGGLAVAVIPLSAATYQRNLTWSDKLALYSDCARKSPGKPRPRNNLGTVLSEVGRYEEAREEFEAALRLRPDYAKASVGLARVHVAAGSFEEAEAQLELAARQSPGTVTPVLELGNVFLLQGELDAAAIRYRQAVSIDPAHFGARFNLGTVLLRLNRPAEALVYLRAAQDLRPDSETTHHPLADAYRGVGQRDLAVEHYQAALRVQGSEEVQFKLGTLLGEMGRWSEARTHLEEAVRQGRGSSQAHNNLANVYLQLGMTEEAAKHYRISTELDPTNLVAHFNLSLAYRRLGLNEEADRHLAIFERRQGSQTPPQTVGELP